MPLTEPVRTLETSPRSVKDARRWAMAACRELGRDDLGDAAAIGISELVTNALLHAAPPIRVRLRGTAQHPRFEVSDGSPVAPVPPPRLAEDDLDEEELLTTVGRGLSVVAMHACAWGTYRTDDGKTVWFEPTPLDADAAPAVEFTDLQPAYADPQPADDGHRVLLRDLPVASLQAWQVHVNDLQRELRLLALAHESAYPMARELSDMFTDFGAQLRRIRGLEDAVQAESPTVDVELLVPADAPPLLGRMNDVLELAEAFCRAERMLTPSIGSDLLGFQRWLLGELVRQPSGAEPVAFVQSGDYS